MHLNLNAAGMTGNCLIHGIVQNLRHKVMQGAFVGAAHIHAGAQADRFQPFQNLNILGGIICCCGGAVKKVCHIGLGFSNNIVMCFWIHYTLADNNIHKADFLT